MEANHWKDYFVFSKKERIGIITLLVLLVLIWLIPDLISPSEIFNKNEAAAFKKEVVAFQQQSQSLNKATAETETPGKSSFSATYSPAEKSTLFYFDPNTLPAEDWKKLGLKDKTIHTILNYTSKGGKFYKPQDLQKIYGLRNDDYDRLLPFVRIEENKKEAVVVEEKKPASPHYPVKEIKQVNINSADTSTWIELPGIGSKLASRIVNFRQKLGGFYSIEQIGEIYGLADSVFQKIKPRLICNSTDVQKININAATIDALKAHPYIKYHIGNAVIQYRNQHGNFQSVNDIRNVQLINDSVFRKISPYLNAP
ncbi:MAG: helix-hairpin-helix domain-containing protein [Agriterribacter sp.]